MGKVNDYPESRREAKQPTKHDTFAVGRAKPPAHLDKVAKKFFRALASRLTTAGVLRDVDEFGLGEYCQAMSDVRRLVTEIAPEGEITEGPNGGKVWNPKIGLLRDARKRAKEWSDRLGLTPKARASLKFPAGNGAPQRVSDDELERFLNGEAWNSPDAPNQPVPFPSQPPQAAAEPSP